MGLLDKLLREGSRALVNAVADKLMEETPNYNKPNTYSPNMNKPGKPTIKRTINETICEIIDHIGNGEYEIKRSISPDGLEAEVGCEIYTRSNNHCKPDPITFGIYRFGARVLYIRIWESYQEYSHTANRQIKNYCDDHSIKMLDFFTYLPNEPEYVEDRIKQQLL